MAKIVKCLDLDGKEYRVDSDELTFRPAVYGLIIEKGKILLSKQWDGYFFLGGGIELGESMSEALIREMKEETGLEVKPIKLVDCKESLFKLPYQDKFVHSILIFYLCEKTGGEFSLDFLEENEKDSVKLPEWIDLNKIRDIKFMSTVDCVEVVEKVTRGKE